MEQATDDSESLGVQVDGGELLVGDLRMSRPESSCTLLGVTGCTSIGSFESLPLRFGLLSRPKLVEHLLLLLIDPRHPVIHIPSCRIHRVDDFGRNNRDSVGNLLHRRRLILSRWRLLLPHWRRGGSCRLPTFNDVEDLLPSHRVVSDQCVESSERSGISGRDSHSSQFVFGGSNRGTNYRLLGAEASSGRGYYWCPSLIRLGSSSRFRSIQSGIVAVEIHLNLRPLFVGESLVILLRDDGESTYYLFVRRHEGHCLPTCYLLNDPTHFIGVVG